MFYLEGKEITIDVLKELVNTSDKVIELMDIDEENNLYFELNEYGIYY